MNKYLIIAPLLLLITQFAFSQQVDINYIKQQEQGLEIELEELNLEKSILLRQGDSLAVPIQQLKSKPGLNIFQRRRLEQLLKSSQEFDKKMTEIDQKIDKVDRDHQAILREIISWYDGQIANTMNAGKGKKLSQKMAQQLSEWNSERNQNLNKIKQNQVHFQLTRPIELDESDSYQTIRQKADLVKDQEDKLRKQVKLAGNRVKELQTELKLRNRMNELIADTYLMDQPTEKLLPQNQARGANDNAAFTETDKSRAQSSTSFDVVDNLLVRTDVGSISNLDLESYIRNMQQMKLQLGQSADSLQNVAEQFYQAAEKKRQDDRKK